LIGRSVSLQEQSHKADLPQTQRQNKSIAKTSLPPAPEIFFFVQGSAPLGFFFVAQRASVSTGAIFAEACGISATIPKSQVRLLSHQKKFARRGMLT
jgi:hypothetical protein